jgi:hypothetical protein
MSQQDRKAQESEVVRRLTRGAGAAALGLAGYFTVSAATTVPMVFGAQPAGASEQPAGAAEALDDRVFVRTIHVPAPRPSASAVRGATGQAASGRAVSAAAGAAQSTGGATQSTVTQQPASQGPAPAPAPPPKPVAASGGSTPAK